MGIDFNDESIDIVKNNQDNDPNDIKLTNLDSITVNGNPISDNELSNKKYIDCEINKNTIVRFNQTLSNCLKVSVGNDVYNLAKYGKLKIIDSTIIKSPNTASYLLQNWNTKSNDRNYADKIQNFIRLTKTNSPSSNSGATSLPPIGDSFLYIETSSNKHGPNVFVSWEGTDIFQITKITSYHNRFSVITDDNLKKYGSF